jgi:ketosteroid isomerase-like protein
MVSTTRDGRRRCIEPKPCRDRGASVNRASRGLQKPLAPEGELAAIADDEVVVQHDAERAGGPRVVGAAAIRATFEAMFANGTVRAWPEQRRKVEAVGSAVHHLVERVEVLTPAGPRQAWVVATNVYLKTAQGWRLVAHHASPGSATEVPEIVDTPQVLH